MGRMIDIDKAREEYRNSIDLAMSDTTLLHTLYDVLDNAPTVEAIPKADYENRLKADMVAMLEELKKEIVEITISKATVLGESFWNMGAGAMKEEIGTRIQQKIDKLKEEKDGENNY